MSELIWHEVECGGYTADLPLWEELADSLGEEEPIMELGCGAGRVTLHLAERGAHLVIGLDRDRELVEAVWERGWGSSADAEHVDVRELDFFATRFGLVLAPMQLIQLLEDSEARIACLACALHNMKRGARAAFAIVEEVPTALPEGALPPLPDVRQVEGWIYSSLPLEPIVYEDSILLRRLRQTVDPDGNMSDELNEIELQMLSAGRLEEEALGVGLRPAGRRQIPATDAHVGSTVVLFEKGS
ncbi:MAG TPA: class I SAM-dependent methyltransferase [Solirubrobacterales bacterium]|nr:class I SAM-dependent methyltransferase [Solirubrobacterales bacterium]